MCSKNTKETKLKIAVTQSIAQILMCEILSIFKNIPFSSLQIYWADSYIVRTFFLVGVSVTIVRATFDRSHCYLTKEVEIKRNRISLGDLMLNIPIEQFFIALYLRLVKMR